MRILYVIDSLAAGGAERSLAAMAPQYATHGMELSVAYLHERPGVQAELDLAGIPRFYLSGSGRRLGWAREIHRLIAAIRPDVVHTTLFEADAAGRAAAWLSGVPVVSSIVNVAYGAEQADAGLRRWKLEGARLLDATTSRVVVRFHANTRYVADVMAQRLRVSRDRIEVIPRGRDPMRLGRRDQRRRARARLGLGVTDGAPLLLAVARHEYQKGLDVLVEALPGVLRQLPGARLVVAGRHGNQSEQLQAARARLGLEGAVAFLGAREDVAELLCAADLLVIPSRWEGLSNVLIEAMALETPVVASDLPTLYDAATDGETAQLVPPGDPNRLARAVVESLDDPAAAAARAARAHQRFLDTFTLDRVVDSMSSFYRRALDASARPAGGG